ncbi:MAG: Hsp20/alpha crystallin family protein [Candidatus Geothermincolia bacterium]
MPHRFNPMRHVEAMEREFNRMMRKGFGEVWVFPELHGKHASDYVPRADLFRSGDDLVMRLELPGVDLDEVDISVDDKVLTVKGTRELDPELRAEAGLYLREGLYGTFERSFVIPGGTSMDNITARYGAGLLTITVPGAAARLGGRKVNIPVQRGEPREGEE